MNIKRTQTGFSLLELAIVIGIVGILMGVLVPPLAARMELRAVNLERETLISFERALIGYAMAEGHLPIPESPLQAGREIRGTFPFAELGITNVSGKQYRYIAESEFLHQTVPGVPGPVTNQLDMTDGVGVIAFRLEVDATADVEVERQVAGTIVLERLVAVGQLP